MVLSSQAYNAKVGLALFCPVTNQVKGYPFEVQIPVGLSVSGVILADQVRSLDWQARNVTFICQSPREVVTQTLEKLDTLLRESL